MTADGKPLTVGTTIDIEGTTFMIAGYRAIQEGDHVEIVYITLPYPLGYTSVESFSLTRMTPEYPVVALGYETEESEAFSEMIANAQETGKTTSYEDFENGMSEYVDALFGGGDNE